MACCIRLICARFNRFIPCHNYLWLAPHLYYLARLHNSFVNCTGDTNVLWLTVWVPHFTVDLSIPSAATIYSLIALPKPAVNNTIEILSISQRAKALIFDRDAIHAVNDPSTCSRNGNGIFCRQMPKMLLNTDNECASALRMAPKKAETFCTKVRLPRDCHLSPIYAVYGFLYYFLGECGIVLNIYNATKLVNSTSKSTLFVLARDYSVAINATTFFKHKQFLAYNHASLTMIP